MNSALSRPVYETVEHVANEQEVAAWFAVWNNAKQLKVAGKKARVDRLLYRDGYVVAYFEVKNRNNGFGDYPDWALSLNKVKALKELKEIVQLPVWVVFYFRKCGTLAFIDVGEDYRVWNGFGRHDRGDPEDIEDGACWWWHQFTTVKMS
jgi:DNA-binding sugar fermentation-stimulating protein